MDPFGMLGSEIIVNLFPQICVGIDLVKHDALIPVCVYLTDAAIASANKMIGQTATNTIMPKATNSDR
ncbi:MAG: hypothetical protein DMF37_06955 [Verrucomicrobia bacterium]|nr:MAG: hypothetical protein DMF37_06955 [Verrucomicrobiota bacterium]